MLTTSDPAATREAFAGLGLAVRGARPDRRRRARRDVGQRPPTRRRRPRLAGLMPATTARSRPRRSGSTSSTRRRRCRPSSTPVGRDRRPDPGARARSAGSRATRRWPRSSSRSRASTEEALVAALEALADVRAVHLTRALDRVFGKRVIVVGGGAQVAQVALGAVSEADRHNLRGERISVDTIPLVGEENIAAAVRAVADLPRARLLVLAGSIMGGDISVAAEELRARRHPDHRAQHGRLDHGARGPRRVRPGPGRHDGGHGRRRHGDVRPRRASAAGATRPAPMRIATWNVNSLKARQEAVE